MEKIGTTNPDLIKWYTEIYTKHYSEILNYIKFKVNDFHKAEDITSITFERFWLYIEDFKAKKDGEKKSSAVTTWLRNIANSCISNYHNGKNGNYMENTSNVSDFVDESGREVFQYVGEEETNSLAERNEFNEKVERVFGNMNPKYRKVATLLFLEDMDYKEIAKVCEIPMGSVKGTISRCRAILQREFQAEMKAYAIA